MCALCTPKKWIELDEPAGEERLNVLKASSKQLAVGLEAIRSKYHAVLQRLMKQLLSKDFDALERTLIRHAEDCFNTSFPAIDQIQVPSLWTAADGSGHYVYVYDKSDSMICYAWYENSKPKRANCELSSFTTRYNQVPHSSIETLEEILEIE
jgi:hypothetical protein